MKVHKLNIKKRKHKRFEKFIHGISCENFHKKCTLAHVVPHHHKSNFTIDASADEQQIGQDK
jgi:hypothetical protein